MAWAWSAGRRQGANEQSHQMGRQHLGIAQNGEHFDGGDGVVHQPGAPAPGPTGPPKKPGACSDACTNRLPAKA